MTCSRVQSGQFRTSTSFDRRTIAVNDLACPQMRASRPMPETD